MPMEGTLKDGLMRTGMMALALGLLALRFLPALPPVWLWLVLPVAAFDVAAVSGRIHWRFSCSASVGPARMRSGRWMTACRRQLDGETRWVEGRVAGLPQNGDGVVRFELADSQSRRESCPRQMRLAWYGGPPVNSGERWRLAVKLKRPRGLLNPHAFDYDAWLLAQRIGATGTVKDGERLAAKPDGPGATASASACWRWMPKAERQR